MKNLLLFTSVLLTSCLFSQNEYPKSQIGISFSPDFNYRLLKNNDGSASSDMVIDSRNSTETPMFGYTTGIHYCYNFTNVIGLETAIQYSLKGYKTDDFVIFSPFPEPNLPESIQINYNYNFIDIPVKVNFSIGKKKVCFFTSVGVVTNIFINETQVTKYRYADGALEKSAKTDFDYKRFGLSPMISAGINYSITPKMNLRIEPTVRFDVLKIINTPVTGYLYNAGVSIGYYYGF
jgi:hypothetical protein